MKRLLFFVSALLLFGAAVAADKVIQSSAKRMPGWIGGMEEGFFIVSAEGGTLDEAQQKAMTRVREQIIYAVATNVHAATSIIMHEVTDNGVIRSHKEMDCKMSVKAADIPYLANVSPSHASDYYWAKVRRTDKSAYFTYHIKYPFSKSKLRTLVEEYEKQQKVINDTLQAFASVDFSTYDDLSEMLLQHSKIRQFEATLHEDDSRREICHAIRQFYERMLSQNLNIKTLSANRQETRVALAYGSKTIACTLVPKAKSNCLTAMNIQNQGDATLISYDFQTGCYEDESNWLDITYNVLNKKISTRCYIK